MTSNELFKEISKKYGFNPWPDKYEVDAETYGNVCQAILDRALEIQFPKVEGDFRLLVHVGPNNGIMFYGVELILKS